MSESGRSASIADSPARRGGGPVRGPGASPGRASYGGDLDMSYGGGGKAGGGAPPGPGADGGMEQGRWLPSELRSHVMRVVVNAGCVRVSALFFLLPASAPCFQHPPFVFHSRLYSSTPRVKLLIQPASRRSGEGMRSGESIG